MKSRTRSPLGNLAVSLNCAATLASIFFHKDRSAKISAGPLWDFDLAYDNTYEISAESDSRAEGLHMLAKGYWARMAEAPEFRRMIKERWFNLRNGAFAKESLFKELDTLVAASADATLRNFELWPQINFQPWALFKDPKENHALAILKLKMWLSSRLEWLDKGLGTW